MKMGDLGHFMMGFNKNKKIISKLITNDSSTYQCEN